MLFIPEELSLKKFQKIEIFQRGNPPWFLSKNWTFHHLCFGGNSSQKRCFFYILDRNECVLDQKSEILKMSKKEKFSKGFSPWFLSKNRNFYHVCLLGKSSQTTSFLDILDRKECFLDQTKWPFKKVQRIKFFRKGMVHAFRQQLAIFLV